jgi:hypothetical protein
LKLTILGINSIERSKQEGLQIILEIISDMAVGGYASGAVPNGDLEPRMSKRHLVGFLTLVDRSYFAVIRQYLGILISYFRWV